MPKVMLYVMVSVALFYLLWSMLTSVLTQFFPRISPMMRLAIEQQKELIAEQKKWFEKCSMSEETVGGLQRQIDDLKRELEEMKGREL